MESGNKFVGVVVFSLFVGVAGYFGRSHITQFFHREPVVVDVVNDKNLAVGGRVIVEAFGKPYIAEDALNQKLQQMLQSSPMTRSMDTATLPPAAKLNFLKDWINFLLIKDVWGKQQNIEGDAAFKKRYADASEALKDSLIIDAFVQDLKKDVVVSDEDIRAEYDANKSQYIKRPGGANCAVVEFDGTESARMLEDRACSASSMSEFKKMVDEMGAGKFTALGFVDQKGSESNSALAKMPAAVRKVLLGRHDESVVLVPSGSSYFVVFMADRKAPQYHEFSQISDQIKGRLEELKQRDALEQALEGLRNSANLVIKADVLGASASNQPRVLSKEELMAAIQENEAGMDEDMGEDGN